ncbi:MAG: response regulator transcription factor [Planctomycetes bacterium]|nr:response regulator transcription factor [Planctomycetota bacterium]
MAYPGRYGEIRRRRAGGSGPLAARATSSTGCQTTILVIEDDEAIRRGLVDALEYGGYTVLGCGDGRRGLALALETPVDLMLLDVMLPGMEGFDVLREVRLSLPTLPVIMVTARGAEEDRVRGLRDGADDYVTKPFSARELLARVAAVLRRSPERPTDVATLRLDGRTIDLERREVAQPDGTRRALSEREAAILRYLAAAGGRVVDRDELLHRVWGLNPRGLTTRTVDMQIARLREKLAAAADDPPAILTVRGKGYMLAERVEVTPP